MPSQTEFGSCFWMSSVNAKERSDKCRPKIGGALWTVNGGVWIGGGVKTAASDCAALLRVAAETESPLGGRHEKVWSTEEPSGHSAGQQCPTGESGWKHRRGWTIFRRMKTHSSHTKMAMGTRIRILHKIHNLCGLRASNALSCGCSPLTLRNFTKTAMENCNKQMASEYLTTLTLNWAYFKSVSDPSDSLCWPHICCPVGWSRQCTRTGGWPEEWKWRGLKNAFFEIIAKITQAEKGAVQS